MSYGSASSPAATRLILSSTLGAILLIAGCASTGGGNDRDSAALRARLPALAEHLFGAPPDLPDPDSLLALTPEQVEHFLDFFEAGKNGRYQPHKRIHVYLARHLSDIAFTNRTFGAAETIDRMQGNCMSLALVTTALARTADVRIGWQIADADPVYSSEGSVIYSANHIQVRLYEDQLNKNSYSFAFGRDYLLLDYFTDELPELGRPLTESEMMALVYQNLGVEALAAGDNDRAFWLLVEALEHDPANPHIYNALGVVHRRAGDDAAAERLYRFALAEFGERLTVLRNYRELLRARGREAEADRIEERILRLPDPDPFPILALGDQALSDGRTNTALAYYRKARRIAPYLHEIHWKIARAHFRAGEPRRAERELEKAREKAMDVNDRRRYDAKLRALTARH